VVDANVERVTARLFALEEPLPCRQGEAPRARRFDHARRARRGFCAGDDGSGLDDLHDASARLRDLSADRRLRGTEERDA
jgi:hypothetical protein